MSRSTGYCIGLALAVLLLFVTNLFVGSVSIPVADVVHCLMGGDAVRASWRYIILESRLPQAVTAMLCGASLAESGLMLQTAFRNPLAGPSIFGISSGAGLGVALVMLWLGGSISAGSVSLTGFVAVLAAAFAGAMVVILCLFFFSTLVRHHVMLLIIGIMIGYLASAVVSMLNFLATAEGVRSYVVWGMGSFAGVSTRMLPAFTTVSLLALAASLLMVKPLNALMLGDRYAENLGVSIISSRNKLLVITGLQAAVVTAFCGPVAFIGLAVPHIARLLFRTDNHRVLMPATMLTGAAVALLCNLLTQLPGEQGVIPLNAVTPLIGAPVIIYVILKGCKV